MNVWNLDTGLDVCCDDENEISQNESGVQVIGVEDADCGTIQVLDFTTGESIEVFLPGPPGPVGPQGPPGSAGGLVAVVSATSVVPMGQVFTVVRGSVAEVNITLPPISVALVAGFAIPYTVSNYSGFQVMVLPTGSDQIMFDTGLLMDPSDTFDFLPTSLGWLIK